MTFKIDDGGRAEAGYKGEARDCVCRATAIALDLPYDQVYADLAKIVYTSRATKLVRDSHPRKGMHRRVYESYLFARGWTWTPTMKIGSGCKVHLRASELPSGRLLVRVSKHLVAVIDGIIYDTHDPSRDGTRCVYGYYSKQKEG
jgi:hypothetical protein